MKKFLKVLSLLLVVSLLSGCVKYNIDMKITKDKKLSMSFITAAAKDLASGEGTTTETDEEQINKLKNEGWKVEEYKDEKFEGFKLTKEFEDIDKLSSSNEVTFDLNSFGEEGKTPEFFFQKKTENGVNVYVGKFAFKVDTSSAGGETQGQTPADAESQTGRGRGGAEEERPNYVPGPRPEDAPDERHRLSDASEGQPGAQHRKKGGIRSHLPGQGRAAGGTHRRILRYHSAHHDHHDPAAGKAEPFHDAGADYVRIPAYPG